MNKYKLERLINLKKAEIEALEPNPPQKLLNELVSLINKRNQREDNREIKTKLGYSRIGRNNI